MPLISRVFNFYRCEMLRDQDRTGLVWSAYRAAESRYTSFAYYQSLFSFNSRKKFPRTGLSICNFVGPLFGMGFDTDSILLASITPLCSIIRAFRKFTGQTRRRLDELKLESRKNLDAILFP